ncbi:MBL fold metallo-hydrolase [Hahella sp. SMD15-11]|uniref:MBL fold metallo-hydrolase n=1 Tax=Thermohahella caldifontis TaxID=3142973 RepID=A0AB39UX42_9GAMM
MLRQLIDFDTNTYTYLLWDDAAGEALIIDPVKSRVPLYLQLLNELGLTLRLAIDTHVHADHITGMGALRDATGCTTALGKETAATCVDQVFEDGDVLRVGNIHLRALHTPGHTQDSYCFHEAGAGRVFTGDTLLIRGTGRTDFQNGDPAAQYDSLFGKLLTLPGETIVYPGHDYRGMTHSAIAEEKAFNPRLQVRNREEYVRLMNALDLPAPRYMDVAVPANLACGESRDAAQQG